MSTFDDDLTAALDTGDRQRIEAESQRLAQFEQRIRAEERSACLTIFEEALRRYFNNHRIPGMITEAIATIRARGEQA